MKESFAQLYTRLYRENFDELEKMRAQAKSDSIKIIFVILGMMILSISIPIIMPIIFLIIIALLIKKAKKSKSNVQWQGKTYVDVFKEKIIAPIIENVFEDSRYEAKRGLDKYEYNKAGYKEHFDRYRSEDLVIAPLRVNNEIVTTIKFAEVHTETVSRDSDGNTTYHTVFWGLAGSFLIPHNLGRNIYIRTNGRVSGWNKKKVKMDMPEFEKIFDVESDDAILVMRILTADVMTEMIELYQKYKYKFEINILDDTVHMRIRSVSMFEPNVFNSSLQYKRLEKYYLVLKAVTSIAEHVYDNISRLEL